jgi:ribosomal protein L29
MKTVDLRKKKLSDLTKLLEDKRETLSLFRYKIAGGRATNAKEGRNTRHDIAQILTILKEKEKEASV